MAAALALVCGASAWVWIPGLSGKPEGGGGDRLIESQSGIDLATRPEDAVNFYEAHDIFRKDAPIEFVNSLEMKFVEVPVFHGKRRVDSLSISTYETRIKDFRQFVASTGHGSIPGMTDSAPVGSFPLSHWGIFDLGGNVWEWCEDQWDVNMNDEKTVRGGCFETQNGNHILSAGRRWIMSHEKNGNVGFRCVLVRGEP